MTVDGKDARQQIIEDAAAAVVGTTAAGLALVLPPLAIPVAAATPWLARAVEHAITTVDSIRRERVAGVVAAASLQPIPVEDLVDELMGGPDGMELFIRVCRAAQDTAREDKLRALARCMRAAYDNPSQIDQELIMTAGIDALDGPHIKLLQQLADGERRMAKLADDEPEVGARAEEAGDEPNPFTSDVLPALHGTLLSCGYLLADSQTPPAALMLGLPAGPNRTHYRVSPLGHLLLDRLARFEDG